MELETTYSALANRGYRPRLIESQLLEALEVFGGACIQGPKYCGKTWTGRALANSERRFFLRQPSVPATADDAQIARDLADTLEAHRASCVGMAANMIGERKRIIAVLDGDGSVLVMLNPEITAAEGEYMAEEGCLSLPGIREVARHRRIVVCWQDEGMRPHEDAFEGRVAQAIQHELDHCNGVLV